MKDTKTTTKASAQPENVRVDWPYKCNLCGYEAQCNTIGDASEAAVNHGCFNRVLAQRDELLEKLEMEKRAYRSACERADELLAACKSSFDVLRREGPQGFDAASERLSAAIASAEKGGAK